MKKAYYGIECEFELDSMFIDVMIASTFDNLIEDDLYEEITL